MFHLSGPPETGRTYVFGRGRGFYYCHIDDVLNGGGKWFKDGTAIARTVRALEGGAFLLGKPSVGTRGIVKYVGVSFTRHPALVHLPAKTEALLFEVISSMLDMR